MHMHGLRNRANLSKWIQSGTCILLNVFKKKIQNYLTPNNLNSKFEFIPNWKTLSLGKNG